MAVSDYEIMQKGKSYTYKTLTVFCEKFPNNQYYFLIGEVLCVLFPLGAIRSDLPESADSCGSASEMECL